MGVRNKQRRRQKAKRLAEKARRQSARGWSPGQGVSGTNEDCVGEELWAAAGIGPDRPARGRAAAEVLVAAGVERVAGIAEDLLQRLVAVIWQHGWQPSELARHARRRDPRLGRIVAAAIVADDERRDPATVHPQWAAQVTALEVYDITTSGWLYDLVDEEASTPSEQLRLIVAALALLAHLGDLPTILSPPGTDPSTWNRREDSRASDDPVLAKVRALLTQAESTTFDAEAETFTAKAHELIARHAIDAARLWSRSDRSDRPVTIRLPVDDPYADQKSHLLHVVARHSRCKAVTHQGLGLVSVVGFAGDVAATEVLFTSLLVQSHAAMLAEAANAPSGAHTRGRAFRSAFLFAYARRIDKRLVEVNETVEAEAADSPGSDLLPALAARAEVIDEAIAATFGPLTTSRARRLYDRLGWDRGVLAADRAQIQPVLPT